VFASPEVYQKLDAQKFDRLYQVRPQYQHRPKFEAMALVPFERALFLDCDTLAIAPLDDLFDVLDFFDIALCPAIHAMHPTGERDGIYKMLPPVPSAVYEWNGGVILAEVGSAFRAFSHNWSSLFGRCHEQGYHMDQAALRSALCHSGLQIATLRNNYNFRTMAQQTVVGQVKILHGKGDLESVAARINQTTDYRLFTPTPSEAGLV